MNVSTTPVNLGVNASAIPLIQNLGTSAVFIGRSPATLATTGVKLEGGDSLELASPVADSGGDLWAATEMGASDVRVLLVG